MQNPPFGNPGFTTGLGSFSSTNFRAAGFWRRLLAWFIDSIIMGLISFPIAMIASFAMIYLQDSNPSLATGLYLGTNALNYVFYYAYVYYFLTRKGATPGKMVLGIKVVDSSTGTYLGGKQVAMREIVGRIACVITLGIGYLIIPFRKDRCGLHDFIGGTRAIRA